MRSANVRASEKIFDTLPKKKFTKEDAAGECAICKCDWNADDEGVELPCHHVYHEDCIAQWFKTSNQCPMCRFEVETDDPEYEKLRKDRLAEQEASNILRTSSNNATPSTSTATSSAPVSTSTSNSSAASPTATTNTTAPRLSPNEQEALLDEVISICSDDSSSMDLSNEYSTCDDDSQPVSNSSESPAGTPQESRRPTNKKRERDPTFDVD